MSKVFAAAVVALSLLAAGCGEDTEVGSDVDLSVKDEAERAALGGSTTTRPGKGPGDGSGGAKAAVGATTTAPPTTAPPITTTTQARRQVAITITINSDTSGKSQLDPSAARVYEGSIVEWVNKNTDPARVLADNGAFDSGTLKPGQRFRWEATRPGRYDYKDDTRPYAVATLEVIARG